MCTNWMSSHPNYCKCKRDVFLICCCCWDPDAFYSMVHPTNWCFVYIAELWVFCIFAFLLWILCVLFQIWCQIGVHACLFITHCQSLFLFSLIHRPPLPLSRPFFLFLYLSVISIHWRFNLTGCFRRNSRKLNDEQKKRHLFRWVRCISIGIDSKFKQFFVITPFSRALFLLVSPPFQ